MPTRSISRDGLYDPYYEHDACGIGFLCNIDGNRSHEVIKNGLQILVNLTHRGALDADAKTGDGASRGWDQAARAGTYDEAYQN